MKGEQSSCALNGCLSLISSLKPEQLGWNVKSLQNLNSTWENEVFEEGAIA